MFSYVEPQYDSGLRRICDIQEANNGWLVTIYKDNNPTADEIRDQMRSMDSVMKHFQQQQQPDEEWKQSSNEISEADIQNLTQRKRSVETHLFLGKEELFAFLVKTIN